MKHLVANIHHITKFEVNVDDVLIILKTNNINCIDYLVHKFPNGAYTYLFLLAESHLAIHEWIEKEFVHIDIFTCSEESHTKKALKEIVNKCYFVQDFHIEEINRLIN